MAAYVQNEESSYSERKSRSAPQPGNGPIAFEAISEPGAYICNWSGHLLRVPRELSAAHRTARMTLVSNAKLEVTRIGSDPEMPVARARALAKEAGITVAF